MDNQQRLNMASKWTGERLETFVFSSITFEHLHRYAFAQSYVSNKTVLDIACGEGYGSNLLAENAEVVIGVDIDQLTIDAARSKYTKQNLKFQSGSVTEIPLPNNFFDVAISFETIEHTDQHGEMLREIKRVLKKDGILIISTPDKDYFAQFNTYNNPFHKKELDKKDFSELLHLYFKNVKFLQQNFIRGSILITEEVNGFDFFSGNYQKLTTANPQAMYWVAIASDEELSQTVSSFFYNEEIYKRIVKQEIQAVKNTLSYRLGHILLSPLKWLRLLFNHKSN
jgi:ubiquinone/menaquinone biosynthesis C-methylase UbiE